MNNLEQKFNFINAENNKLSDMYEKNQSKINDINIFFQKIINNNNLNNDNFLSIIEQSNIIYKQIDEERRKQPKMNTKLN
jgi:selenophosphate synthase